MKRFWYFISLLCIGLLIFTCTQPARAQNPPVDAVVHAVLFYSPSCSHCHYVITEVLQPLVDIYGARLSIIGVDVTQSDGQALFLAALQYFNVESSGVPFLVVGDNYLIGSADIPEKFPGLVEQHLAQGGVGWPEIPGLAEMMLAAETAQAPASTEAALTPTPAPPKATPTPAGLILSSGITSGLAEKFSRDPQGNSLAIVVLAGMLFSVIGGGFIIRHSSRSQPVQLEGWIIFVLSIIGLGVAGYLAYVETAHVDAVCGPVGDCNTVQQSEYARLFGIFPIGLLGVLGYGLILLAWALGRSQRRRLTAVANLAMLAMTFSGVLFSIYLTFLEPFVIGATCAWCLSSAIIMTVLYWLTLAPGRLAFLALFPAKA
jgi:uncharacterized membrane protein